MPPDYWDSGVRQFGHIEEDEEEWTPNRREPWPGRVENPAPIPVLSEGAGPAKDIPSRVLVSVRLGKDRLPEMIEFDAGWQRSVPPEDFGKSVLEACEFELFKATIRLIESGAQQVGGLLPPRRQRMLALLRTTSFAQFKEFEDKLRSIGDFAANGPTKSQWGESVVSVRADRSGLTDVIIEPTWAETARLYEVQGEILDCVAEIRRQLAAFTPVGNESHLSDEELELSVEAHFKRLRDAEA